MTTATSRLGQTLGPYQILRAVGAGGMGEVYEAAHTRLAGKRYAIKVLLPALADANLLARFRREAEILARLAHPNIVAVHDFDTASDGAVYLVMDLLEGEDLAARMARSLLAPAEVARIIGQVASALDAAHAAGVVHRDLKPANIFLCKPDDRAVVLDFGVAKDTTDGAALTAAGELFGTPMYMSPEQASGRGNAVDGRTDVFALAAIAFEMLAGRPAFTGPSITAILTAITTGPRPDLVRARPDLGPSVAAVLGPALAIEPNQRTASVRELAGQLEAALAGVAAAPVPDIGPTLPPADIATDPTLPPRSFDDPPLHLDDNVQFTVYRPKIAAPETWHPLLAFAHLSEAPIDAPPGTPDPIEEVKRLAEQALGDSAGDYRDVTADSRQSVPKEGELTFVPEVAGVSFNPPSRSFLWLESVHREEFRFKAPGRLAGSTARGRMTVYLGRIILAEIGLAIRVGAAAEVADTAPSIPAHARPYRKIFASYDPGDAGVVAELERYAKTLGDLYLNEALGWRAAGWSDQVAAAIGGADVFQLFWSHRSMRSPQVRAEWEHALSLGRDGFVRPTYWEEPLPADPAAGLPPPSLAQLRFERLGWSPPPKTIPTPTAPRAPAPGFPAGGPKAMMGAPPEPPRVSAARPVDGAFGMHPMPTELSAAEPPRSRLALTVALIAVALAAILALIVIFA